MRPKLIIFAKAPIMGQAKTRLAADVGVVHAKRLYRAMSAKIIRDVQDPRWDTYLAITPKVMMGRVPEWHDVSQYPQVTGSLTPRLMQAFSDKGPTVVIGTDCPQIKASDISDAFAALKRWDVVLGPAEDGGFWLIGLDGPAPHGLFDHVRWSSQYALQDVTANIVGAVGYLRTLTDVDDAEALRVVRQSFRQGPS